VLNHRIHPVHERTGGRRVHIEQSDRAYCVSEHMKRKKRKKIISFSFFLRKAIGIEGLLRESIGLSIHLAHQQRQQ
jgi:hypothetical protein